MRIAIEVMEHNDNLRQLHPGCFSRCYTEDTSIRDMEMVDAMLQDSSREKNSLPDLPCEVQLIIYEHLVEHSQSLAALAISCKGTQEAATKVLYENITVDNKDLTKMFNLIPSTCKGNSSVQVPLHSNSLKL